MITRVWLRAHPLPEVERRAAFVFASFSEGIEACRRIIRAGATPAVLRLYDGAESKRSHGGDGTQCTLLVLDEGNVIALVVLGGDGETLRIDRIDDQLTGRIARQLRIGIERDDIFDLAGKFRITCGY